MVSAGRVLIIPKGAYNPATTYEMLDLVSYNGSSYIAKATTTGNLPTDTTYWQLSAYGGQAANIAGNFAEMETSSVATVIHYENDIFVDENSQLMKATQTINIGDTIDENTNCTPTTVEALVSFLSSYVDSLDSLNKKIQGAIEIAAQSDLHSLAIGEYYKKQSSFYITNGPTGIDQDPTAIFRLTVEAALDNASQASSPLLLTLRTPDGKIYAQGFDGTNWGSWKQIADKSSLDAIEARVDVVENSVADVDTRVDSVESSVADVETSSTASKAYAIGESFYYNDVLYKATAAISQGGTITPGTNCTPEKIIKKIDDLVSKNQILMQNTYQTTDATETTLASDDIVPFYDTSATAKKKMTVQKMAEQLISNRNLLDNPWFTVNQRGESTYSFSNRNNYCLDRWCSRLDNSNLTITKKVNHGITCSISGQISWFVLSQILSEDLSQSLVGKTVTISAMISNITTPANLSDLRIRVYDASSLTDNTIQIRASGNMNVAGISSFTFIIPSTLSSGQLRLDFYVSAVGSCTFDIDAIKLEISNISTLAMDTVPNYATELLKCQRYFVRLAPNSSDRYGVIGQGIMYDGTRAWVPLNMPVAMRAKPSISYNLDSGKIKIAGKGSTAGAGKVVTTISVSDRQPMQLIYFDCASQSDLSAGDAVMIWFAGTSDAYIDLSADL